jgi:hypothetical protein
MSHFSHFSFHVDFIFCRFDNFVWFFDSKIADSSSLLVGNLDFGKNAVANRTEYPNFITAFDEIIVAFTNKITIYGIEQKVIKDHERVEWNPTIFEYKDRDKHSIVEQVLRHCCIHKRLIFLNLKSWVGEILFHDTHYTLRWIQAIRTLTTLRIRSRLQTKKASKFESLLTCNSKMVQLYRIYLNYWSGLLKTRV